MKINYKPERGIKWLISICLTAKRMVGHLSTSLVKAAQRLKRIGGFCSVLRNLMKFEVAKNNNKKRILDSYRGGTDMNWKNKGITEKKGLGLANILFFLLSFFLLCYSKKNCSW